MRKRPPSKEGVERKRSLAEIRVFYNKGFQHGMRSPALLSLPTLVSQRITSPSKKLVVGLEHPGLGAKARLLTLCLFRQFCSCNNHVRSPLTPLQKGGTGNLLKVPLFKGSQRGLGGFPHERLAWI